MSLLEIPSPASLLGLEDEEDGFPSGRVFWPEAAGLDEEVGLAAGSLEVIPYRMSAELLSVRIMI